jgi:X-Pro dipeptidyl-peptidase
MEAAKASALVLVLLVAPIAGCIGTGEDLEEQASDDPSTNETTDYAPPERNPEVDLVETSHLVDVSSEDVEIHVRIVRPADVDQAPVIAEFTPYNAPGRAMLVEPAVDRPSGTYVEQFVERGFAFAFADVRGTSDSGGCLDLRGSMDVEDAGELTAWLGTQDWSSGEVGFVGASYPGSEAHIAAIADDEHLGGVIPVVASTSFYHYHHKAGVPYDNHLTTNAGYTAFATAPSANPQHPNWLTKEAYQATECEQPDQLARGLDQSGAYDAWWQDRDLNHRIDEIDVPVLMAQGLADWNVKPDHIDPWFNELDVNKTLIAGQWGHAYPADTDEDVYGDWWELAVAFFDQTLDGADTGLFAEDRAHIQDNAGDWHTYEDTWPPAEAEHRSLNLTADGLGWDQAPEGEVGWQATKGQQTATDASQVVLRSEELDEDLHLSGTPELNLTIEASEDDVHLVAVLAVDDGEGPSRQNFGYLDPTYRSGLEDPQRLIPGEPTPVTIEMYPQEDVIPAGSTIELTLRSHDEGRTVPAYDSGEVTVHLDGERPGQLALPVSPLAE